MLRVLIMSALSLTCSYLRIMDQPFGVVEKLPGLYLPMTIQVFWVSCKFLEPSLIWDVLSLNLVGGCGSLASAVSLVRGQFPYILLNVIDAQFAHLSGFSVTQGVGKADMTLFCELWPCGFSVDRYCSHSTQLFSSDIIMAILKVQCLKTKQSWLKSTLQI